MFKYSHKGEYLDINRDGGTIIAKFYNGAMIVIVDGEMSAKGFTGCDEMFLAVQEVGRIDMECAYDFWC